MRLPESFKGTDSSGETLVATNGKLQTSSNMPHIDTVLCYNEMIRLFPLKVPNKNYSDVDWIRQAKNTELTCSSITFRLWFCSALLILCERSRCKRKRHWVNECTMVCVCVCVCIYIDMVFRDNIVQTANMFSVTNARDYKSNCEFNVLFFESGPGKVWGNWIKSFLKIRKFHSYSYFLALCRFW